MNKSTILYYIDFKYLQIVQGEGEKEGEGERGGEGEGEDGERNEDEKVSLLYIKVKWVNCIGYMGKLHTSYLLETCMSKKDFHT